jgi:hypothetical protein
VASGSYLPVACPPVSYYDAVSRQCLLTGNDVVRIKPQSTMSFESECKSNSTRCRLHDGHEETCAKQVGRVHTLPRGTHAGIVLAGTFSAMQTTGEPRAPRKKQPGRLGPSQDPFRGISDERNA